MFETGTKVVVIASDVNGDKTGPKRGSIGYFINNQDFAGNGTKNMNSGCLIEHASAVFTRFGFEQKTRSELKSFIAFYPSIPRGIPIDNDDHLEEWVLAYIQKVERGEVEAHKYAEAWLGKKLPGLMVFPLVAPVNLNTGPFSEFKSWFEAIVNSNSIISMLTSYYQNKKNKDIVMGGKVIGKANLEAIINCATSKADRVEMIKRLSKFPEGVATGNGVVTRENLILVVAFINLMAKRYTVQEINRRILHADGPEHPFIRIAPEIPSLVHYPKMLEGFKHTLKTIGAKNIEETFKTIDKITSVLGAFSSPLLRRGEEYPYKEKRIIESLMG